MMRKYVIPVFAMLGSVSFSNAGFSQTNTPCAMGAPVAPALPVNPACVTSAGTTVGAAYNTNAANGGVPGCASPGAPDVWYSFVAPAGGSVVIDLGAGGITDSGMALYSGGCGSWTEIACDDDGGTGLMSQISAGGLTPGATYMIRIWNYGGSGTGTFTICVSENVVPPGCAVVAPVPNDACYQAVIAADSFCCDTDWDTFCQDAYDGCTTGCTAVSPEPNDSCYQVVIAADAFCCDDTWDAVCQAAYDDCFSSTPPLGNAACDAMEPICSDTPITFTAGTNVDDADITDPGNNYGCLSTSPNPSWFYLELLTDGTISMNMSAGSDIDFALWGPYADFATAEASCGSYPLPLDCSYSISATEQANVASALAGQVYVLLVTNYANVTQVIDLNSAPGNTALTDCSIILPIELVELYATAEHGSNTLYWTTMSELSNDLFIVQRSYTGSSFTSIGVVDGAGNSSAENVYAYQDRDYTEQLVYYRLKQVDFDGTARYSEIVTVNRAAENVLIYPNPTTYSITIDFPANRHGDFDITYRDLLGREFKEKTTIGDDVHSYSSEVFETLPEGIYIVEITDENGTLISLQKVVKGK